MTVLYSFTTAEGIEPTTGLIQGTDGNFYGTTANGGGYGLGSKARMDTSPSFPFPYLYDFSLKTVLYYYPDPNNAGHYNTDGVRYFYRFDTGQIISK